MGRKELTQIAGMQETWVVEWLSRNEIWTEKNSTSWHLSETLRWYGTGKLCRYKSLASKLLHRCAYVFAATAATCVSTAGSSQVSFTVLPPYVTCAVFKNRDLIWCLARQLCNSERISSALFSDEWNNGWEFEAARINGQCWKLINFKHINEFLLFTHFFFLHTMMKTAVNELQRCQFFLKIIDCLLSVEYSFTKLQKV